MKALLFPPFIAALLAGCAGPAANPPVTGPPVTAKPASSAPPPDGFGNGALLRAFNDIAFTAEHPGLESARPAIAKWRGPVRIETQGLAAQEARFVADYAARLARLTGHDIALSAPEEPAGMRVIIAEASERPALVLPFLRNAAPPLASALIDWRDRGNVRCITITRQPRVNAPIDAATVLIRAELPPENRQACLEEEIAQALGLLNDSPRAAQSIFSDHSVHNALTLHDEYLLRLLYDPRIRPGMGRKEAMRQAESIMREIRPEGE